MNFKPQFTTPDKSKGAGGPSYEPVSNYMVHVKDMITFRPDQTIQEVIDIIIDKRISGAPVLDSNKKLVGMISEKDCLKIIVDHVYHNLPMETRKVSDYMTKEVKTMAPTSDVVSAANEFLSTPIRRMPVVDNHVLLGQISRRDILRAAKKISPTTW
ncbi:MAG: CBS domain-containing protein [Flammeovirgaceae bacterium]|nr:CBS domain-containing protein [Flammeovirgaceae bacterium]